MLNLYELKKNKTVNINAVKNMGNKTKKFFPSPIREWNSSIYCYNKNSLNLIPAISLIVNNFVKSYFYSYNKHLENKLRTEKILLRLRRLSTNKFFVTDGKYKHTNNKVIQNIYIFNRQKISYLAALKKWFRNKLFDYVLINKHNQVNKHSINKNNTVKRNLIERRFFLIKNNGLEAVKLINKDKYYLIKALNSVNNSYNTNKFVSLSKYIENYYKILIKSHFDVVMLYYYYKQLLFINKSKLNYTYLIDLKKYLEKIFCKNVEFNIINLKRFFLNSDILSESLALKVSKNRKKLNKYMRTISNKTILERKKIYLGFVKPENKVQKIDLTLNKDRLKQNILDSIKYKHITGLRLQAKGRLSKRFSASRSMEKIIYKGAIVNFDSSYRGISTVLTRGNQKSNTQISKLRSKSRIGSFGIKGWVSGN